jgi:predicted ATPase
MLRRLRVRGFKSLHDIEIELAPLVVLFGPNAAGKSNLLEAMQLLSRMVTERTLKDAFGEPLRGHPLEAFSLPDDGLQGLLTQQRAELSLEADIDPGQGGNSKPSDSLRYRASVAIRPATGELTVTDEYLVRLKKDLTPQTEPSIERAGKKKLLVRQLRRAGTPTEKDLGLGYTLASNVHLGGETRYPDFDRLRKELAEWRMYDLDPRAAMRVAQVPREVDDIGLQGEWIAPFLYRLKNSEQHHKSFDAVVRALRSAIPSIERLDVDLDPKRGSLDIQVWQEGVPFSSRVISEGTLRSLALCAIAANPWSGQMVAIEEPENGVHPQQIEVVASLLVNLARRGHTQVVVTTHSPTLVATMVRLQATWPEGIQLLRCVQEGMATRVSKGQQAVAQFAKQPVSQITQIPVIGSGDV